MGFIKMLQHIWLFRFFFIWQCISLSLFWAYIYLYAFIHSFIQIEILDEILKCDIFHFNIIHLAMLFETIEIVLNTCYIIFRQSEDISSEIRSKIAIE